MPPENKRARQMKIPLGWQGGVLVLLLLGACASNSETRDSGGRRSLEPEKPSVSEQSLPLRQPDSPYRTVVHGDTLYSIAWESGQDFRALAKWNGIKPPYTIKPGQELRVLPPPVQKAVSAKTTPVPAKTRQAAENKTTDKTSKPAAKPAASPKPATPVASAKKPKEPTRPKPSVASAKAPSGYKTTALTGSWMWPADGQLLKRSSDNDAAKGLDIGGTRGQAVRASANGRVVYQGSGLRGYGQLIIIKHNDEYLSAYAHNDRIYVKEGDVVKRGQKIADMGSTGTDRVKLHFEIRRQGAPIDPLKFLPKR